MRSEHVTRNFIFLYDRNKHCCSETEISLPQYIFFFLYARKTITSNKAEICATQDYNNLKHGPP